MAGLHVRGDDQHFGELNMPVRGIHHPEITGLYTITPRKDGSRLGYTPPRNNRVVYHSHPPMQIGVSGPEVTGFILGISFANYNRGGGSFDIQR